MRQSASVPHAVVTLRWEDERRAATLLARAFVDDPLVIAICAAPARERWQRMQWSFRIAIRSHCLAAQPAWGVVDARAMPIAAALVVRPGTQVETRSDTVFALRGLMHIGLRATLRGMKAAQIIRSHLPRSPFTYLRTLGVDPAFQRRGLGSALVEQVIRMAPALLPVYLETAREQNVHFYARHGFSCIGEFRCLGVPVWRLQRPSAQ